MSQRRSNAACGLASATLKAWTAVTRTWRTLLADQARPARSYRPELHYMRGPGPKWRKKHARWNDSTAR